MRSETTTKYKYPIGTRIKYIGSPYQSQESALDKGKIGKIVGYEVHDYPLIFLPESNHVSIYSTELVPVSWQVSFTCIKILSQKGEQLFFDFAY